MEHTGKQTIVEKGTHWRKTMCTMEHWRNTIVQNGTHWRKTNVYNGTHWKTNHYAKWNTLEKNQFVQWNTLEKNIVQNGTHWGNIARGTADPEIDSVTWTKFGNNMAPLA